MTKKLHIEKGRKSFNWAAGNIRSCFSYYRKICLDESGDCVNLKGTAVFRIIEHSLHDLEDLSRSSHQKYELKLLRSEYSLLRATREGYLQSIRAPNFEGETGGAA